MNWWRKASEAEKLAQCEGGIELGMSQAQIAMNCRVSKWTIMQFCLDHGISRGKGRRTENGEKACLRAAATSNVISHGRANGMTEMQIEERLRERGLI